MKSINWFILGVVVVLLAATALYLGFSTNNLSIIVDTNGSNTNVNYPSILAGSLPQGMMNEKKNKASDDVESSNSTVDTVKADIKLIALKYN